MIFPNLAQLSRANGRLDQARAYFQKALILAEARGWQRMADEMREELSRLAEDAHTLPEKEHLKVFI